MNILSGIKKLIGKKNALTGYESRFFGDQKNAYSTIFRDSRDYLNAYELCNYLGNLISIISGDISRLDWEIVDSNGRSVDGEDLINFIKNPCDYLQYKQFVEVLILHYILDGNVFVGRNLETKRDVKYKTAKLHPLIPSTVSIYDETGAIVTAGYTTNSKKASFYSVEYQGGIVNIPPELVHHVAMLGPKNIIRGLGKVQQNSALLDSDRMTSIFNNSFFSQGARVSLIITPSENLSSVMFREYSEKIRDVYEGARNHGKILISPIAGDVRNGNISQNDMQFIEQRKLTREDIRDILQVPAIRLSGGETRYDSAQEQLRSYYSFCLPSFGSVINSVFDREIAIRTGRSDLKFKIKYPTVFDMNFARDLFDRGAITQNEYREMFGRQKIKDKSYDERFMTMQYTPVSQIFEQQTPIQLPAHANNQPEPQQPQKPEPKKGIDKKKFSRAQQYNIHKQATLVKRQCEKRITKDVKAFYEGMKARMLAKIKSSPTLSKKSIDDPFSLEEEVQNAKTASKPMFMASIMLSLNELNRVFETEIDTSTKNKFVRLVVEKLSTRYATQTMNTRYEELRTLFGSAQEQGLSINEISGSLTEYFDDLSGENAWKATRIAKTEAFYAWDQAAVNAYQEIGVTIVDVIGCEDESGDCNRQEIPIDEAVDLEFHPNHTGTIVPQK